MSKNKNLADAKKAKNDEFYTQLSDIENELCHYKEFFEGKIVYCNCDDPKSSAFWKFFVMNFKEWKLKKLIATHYEKDEHNFAYKLEFTASDIPEGKRPIDVMNQAEEIPIQSNGDFRSQVCLDLLDEADIVVTNPPFSLFREYLAILMSHNKKFLIIGNKNSITYKEVFPLLKDNKMWLGYTSPKKFLQPDGTFKTFGNIGWFTNLDINKRHEPLDLRGNKYSPEKYPKYDNYDAINVDKVNDIPEDYFECIGVPITFLDKYNPEQFEIVGADFELASPVKLSNNKVGTGRFYLNESEEKRREEKRREEKRREEKRREDSTPELSSDARCNGIMGVPITFLDWYCPEQFEIIGATESEGKGFSCGIWDPNSKVTQPLINGTRKYKRLFIKFKNKNIN